MPETPEPEPVVEEDPHDIQPDPNVPAPERGAADGLDSGPVPGQPLG